MNQQQDFQSSFTSSAKQKNAAYYREKAREALKKHWGLAIIAFLLAAILGAEGFHPEFELELELKDLKEIPFGSLETMFVWGKQFIANNPALQIAAVLAFVWDTVFTLAVVLFVGAPLKIGYEQLQLDWMEGKHQAGYSKLFSYFKVCYRKAVVLRVFYTLMQLACLLPAALLSLPLFIYVLSVSAEAIGTVVLLSLLAAFGGLVSFVLNLLLRYNYLYCFMILGEGPEMSPVDALRNSRQLMRGNKWKLFCMDFSFFGWFLLCLVTCGFAMLYVAPYYASARASFFMEISSLSIARETEFPSLNPDDYNHLDESSF